MSQALQQRLTIRFDLRDLFVHVGFIVLFVMAFRFYAERMFADASYYLLHVINKGWFYIEHDRLVLALSEIFPWLGVTLGVPMKGVLILFSIGHVCFFYVLFLICRYRYQDQGAGLLLILLQTLALEMGYFTPMFELYYGAALLVLFGSILWNGRLGMAEKIVFIPLILCILTSHPVAVLLWGFVLVMHAMDFGRKYLKLYAMFGGVLLLYIGYKLFAASDYEQTKTLSFIDTYRNMSYGWSYIAELSKFMLRYYLELLLLFVMTLSWLIADKKYLRLAFVLLSFLGMMVIINGAHYAFQHSRYQEQVYFPLSFIVAFPLTLLMTFGDAKNSWRKWAWIVCGIVIMIKMIAIVKEAGQFENRIQRMERLVTEVRSRGIQKAIIGEQNVTSITSAGPNWSYGIETLLLSARDGRDKAVTISLDTDLAFENNRGALTPEMFMMRKWDIYPATDLNPRYFLFVPADYVELNAQDTLLSLPLDTFKTMVSITLPAKDLHMPRGAAKSFDLIIENSGTVPLPSDSTSAIFFCYHWMRGEEMVVWDGQRTSLEVDIDKQYSQTLDVIAPEESGHYTLVVDLVAEGQGWFGIDTKRTVWVY